MSEIKPFTPLEEAMFSTRTYNALKRHRINSMEELAEYSEMDLIRSVRGLGRRGFDEIRRKLGVYGLRLRKE